MAVRLGTLFVFTFDELDQAETYAGNGREGVRTLLGGKGANLADMTRMGIPVPPGFIVTTEACNNYLANKQKFPKGLWEQVLEAVKTLEGKTEKRFGSVKNPLLVSCRSGAKFSMPGMMDTILNIGMNDAVAEGMIGQIGDARFVYDSYRRLVQMYGSVVLGVPDEAFEVVITQYRTMRGVENDTELTAEDWKEMTEKFKGIVFTYTKVQFPEDLH